MSQFAGEVLISADQIMKFVSQVKRMSYYFASFSSDLDLDVSALRPRKIISLPTAPTAHCTDSSENLAYITCVNE